MSRERKIILKEENDFALKKVNCCVCMGKGTVKKIEIPTGKESRRICPYCNGKRSVYVFDVKKEEKAL